MGREADNFHLMRRLRMRGATPILTCALLTCTSGTLWFYKEAYERRSYRFVCLWPILTVGLCFEVGVRNGYWDYNKPR